MNCDEVSIELESFLQGELEPSLATEIACHLDGCESCADQAEDLSIILESLDFTSAKKPSWIEDQQNSGAGREDFSEVDFLSKVLDEPSTRGGSASSASRKVATRKGRSRKRKQSARWRTTTLFIFAAMGLIGVIFLSQVILVDSVDNSKVEFQRPEENSRTPDSAKSVKEEVPDKSKSTKEVGRKQKVEDFESRPVKVEKTKVNKTPNEDSLEKPSGPKVSPEEQDLDVKDEQETKETNLDTPSTSDEAEGNSTLDPVDMTTLAFIVGGKDRVLVNQEVVERGLRVGDKVTVKKGSKGVLLSLTSGASVSLSGGSALEIHEVGFLLSRGQTVVDLRDCSETVKFGWSQSVEFAPGCRFVLGVNKRGGPKRFDLLNGTVKLSDQSLGAGEGLIWNRKGMPKRVRAVTREPSWSRRLKPTNSVLFDLETDFLNSKWPWELGRLVRRRKRSMLLAESSDQKKYYDFAARRKPVDSLFRYFPGTFLQLKLTCRMSCSVTLRIFDATRQDNYDYKLKVRQGQPRQVLVMLDQFVAADGSKIPLGEGHTITGTAILVKSDLDPQLHILEFKVLRRSDF